MIVQFIPALGRETVTPYDLDQGVAKLKLESMGIKIDRLTTEQA